MSNILTDYSEMIECALDKLLPATDPGYQNLRDAVDYSMKAGGKRLRPALTLEFCRVCGGFPSLAVNYGCAVEMIHTYSLIHDDLPCMDNDDFRRGKPSCHKVYGEDIALLAGDALQPLAFNTVSLAPLSAEQNMRAVTVLSEYCGINGMVGGQTVDLNSESEVISHDTLLLMHRLKTGALIKAACVLGCIAGERYDLIRNAEQFAENIGYAFQIRDDILDVIGNEADLGKPIGSDRENNKVTYVSLFGIDESERMVKDYTDLALASLDVFGTDSDNLREFALMMANRMK